MGTFTVWADALAAGDYYIPNEPGGGGDYFANLSEAFDAINQDGIDGDVNLLINGNITQTENVGLYNSSEHTITIRPADDNDYTITFDHAVDDNAGPSGSIILGIKSSLAWADITPTKNIVVDGYADGGSTRRLKIMTADTHHLGNPPFVLMDDCSNITIKNTIIEHRGTTAGTGIYAIYLRVRKASGTEKMPSDITIENNHITADKNTAFQGIGLYADVLPSASATGVKIKDNVIIARTRGIFLNYVNGIEITGNEISVKQTSAGMLSSGIYGNAGITGDVIINGNKFTELNSYNSTAGDYGMKGIVASGGGEWHIDNNYFAGLNKGYGDGGEIRLQYIRTGSPCHIRHNTFYLPSLTKKPNIIENPTDAQSQFVAISIAAGTPEIKNNIFVSDETEVYNHFIRGGVGGDSENNIFYFDEENEKARINATYADLASYQSANSGKDVDSKFVKVEFANAAIGDLSIAGASVKDGNLSVPRLDDVLTDLFGTVRAEQTYAGAHEAELPFIFTQVTNPNTNKDISIMQTPYGIEVALDETSLVELYNINGQLLDRTTTSGVYTRDLQNGIYILRINGQSVKFIK